MYQKALIITAIFYLTIFNVHAQKRYLMKGQSKEYPIYTKLDSASVYKDVEKIMSERNLNVTKVDSLLNVLKPHAKQEDPLAMLGYYFAYDKVAQKEVLEFLKTPVKDKRNTYLLKLANQNFAIAELLLFEDFYKGKNKFTYNVKQPLTYLKRAIIHGDTFTSAYANVMMASIYQKGNEKMQIDTDSLKASEYLQKALASKNFNIEFMAKRMVPELYKTLKQ